MNVKTHVKAGGTLGVVIRPFQRRDMTDHAETVIGGKLMKVKTHLRAGAAKVGGGVEDMI